MSPRIYIAILILQIAVAGIITTSCSKEIDVNLPDSAQQVVVEGNIEINTPPVVILTKSVKFFSSVNLNDIGSYFVHGAQVTVTSTTGQSTVLNEYCLQSLNLGEQEQELVLNALGFTTIDSANIPNVCFYTVPDILSYFLTGTCSFMGAERTGYSLSIVAPPFSGADSVRVSSFTRIPTRIGLDSLSVGIHPNESYRDSFAPVYAHFTVPDTFGNFVRYWTKRNSEPFYKPLSQSVYDDRLFVGLSIGLPLERGQVQSRDGDFDINTYSYFRKGDTVTVKWSNIDDKTYDFFYTMENDGGNSPFSNPIRIKSNIVNGMGVWAGYASSFDTIIVPQ